MSGGRKFVASKTLYKKIFTVLFLHSPHPPILIVGGAGGGVKFRSLKQLSGISIYYGPPSINDFFTNFWPPPSYLLPNLQSIS